MLDAGLPVDSCDGYGSTALHYGASENRKDVVEKLLLSGACKNKQNFDGWTPLHMAANNGSTDVIIVLLRHGASKDIVDVDVHTPLHYARVKNQETALRLLEEN